MARTNRALNSAANITEKAVVGLFRWAATDHINKGRPIQFIPGTTFLGSLGYILLELFLWEMIFLWEGQSQEFLGLGKINVLALILWMFWRRLPVPHLCKLMPGWGVG